MLANIQMPLDLVDEKKKKNQENSIPKWNEL